MFLRKFIFLPCLLLFALFFLNSNAFTAIEKWELSWVPAEKTALQKNIQKYLNNGWIPIGLSGNSGKIFIFYIYNPTNSLGLQKWSLNWYKNSSALNRGLSEKRGNGFFPFGLTYFQRKMWVFYIKTRKSAPRYRIDFSKKERYALSSKINSLFRYGYFPSGITFHKNEVMFISLKQKNTHNKTWKIISHSNNQNTFKTQVSNMMNKGWIPYTFSYKNRDVYIFYFKNK